jgi:hypothetical protein
MNTLDNIEKEVRAEYPFEQYRKVCEAEIDQEFTLAYLKSATGKENSIIEGGEIKYEADLASVEKMMKRVQDNKVFLQKKING